MRREKICAIYIIENIENGKKYVGQGQNVYVRWSNHKKELNRNNHDNDHLQKAWNKYGKESFIFYIIEYCKSTDELNYWETYWTKTFKTFGYCGEFGYNTNEGGGGSLGYKHSDKTRKKMSDNHGQKKGEMASFFGKHHSKETRDHLSRIHKGKKASEEQKVKMSIAKRGKKFSEQHKQHMKDNHSNFSGENHPVFGKKSEKATSKYFGVSFAKHRSKWAVHIKINKKTKYIGIFKEEIEAAKAYDRYIIENKINHPLNFPET